MRDSRSLLISSDFPPVYRDEFATLQVNLGYRCNMTCAHCHVNAGPTRTEEMSDAVIDQVLALLTQADIKTLDLTGGAPELNPGFRRLVQAARARGVKVIDRCNLTILFEPGQEDLAAFLAEQGVEIVASLPCYVEENVAAQRGKGVYSQSIEALRLLNELGYGSGSDEERVLNLVYNPIGPTLPPPQEGLEADYRRELGERFGVQFNHLFTITNMPISRFGAVLLSQGTYPEYMQLLRDAYSDANLTTVMCRNMISVDWRGYLFDCDFNQMLDLPLTDKGKRAHIGDLLAGLALQDRPIATAEHCFGCTAGQGSSCGGALADA